MSQMGFHSSVGFQVNFVACPVKINASSWSLTSGFSLPELGVSLLGGRLFSEVFSFTFYQRVAV